MAFGFALNVLEDGHEPEVHVQLLMAMEERVARIVGGKVHVNGLERHDVDDVFVQAAHLAFADLGDLESVTMEMDRMLVAAAVAQHEAVTLALV
jgi:hypothetical protein